MMERKIRRGEIYIADLDPVVGSEQGGAARNDAVPNLPLQMPNWKKKI